MVLTHPEGCAVELPLTHLLKDSCEIFTNSCNPVVLARYRLCDTGAVKASSLEGLITAIHYM